LLEERPGPGGALLVQAVVDERKSPRFDHHEAGRVTANLDRCVGVGAKDRNGPGKGHNLALREYGTVDKFAAVAGDPDADLDVLRRHWDFGDQAPERLSGVSEDGPGPDTEQFPFRADQRQLDRDRSDVDAESVCHNRLASAKVPSSVQCAIAKRLSSLVDGTN